ncbi:MAG: hypothetical protein ACYTGP_12085 [Planctomycetota bacterium]|jgi:hypothetical protein
MLHEKALHGGVRDESDLGTAVAPPRRGAEARPLTPGEAARADQIARRLHAGIGALVGGLPVHAHGASGMSRHLDVVRNTCQRVVAALAEPSPGPALLARLPGVKGMRLLVEGFRQRGADAGDLAAMSAAIEQFAEFIKESAGSQSKLARRLASEPAREEPGRTAPSSAPGLAVRRRLYDAATDLMGRRCDLGVTIYAYRLEPSDPSHLERAMATGDIGQVARPSAMPRSVVLGNVKFQEEDDRALPYESLDHTPAHGSTPHALLEEFCSKPLPLVTSRGSQRRLVHVIDSGPHGTDEPIDFVVANRSIHPSTLPDGRSALEGVWKLVNYPTRHLVFDVFLHRSMERLYRPGIETQMWSPGLDIAPAERWLTRFPNGPRLQLLGAGIEHAHTDAFPRYVELAAAFFGKLGWDPADFVGFRCEVEYPIWRSGYFMTFEHLDAADAER